MTSFKRNLNPVQDETTLPVAKPNYRKLHPDLTSGVGLRRALAKAMIVALTALLALPIGLTNASALLAPPIDSPIVTLGLPATAMLGSNITFPVTFNNNDGEGETGYGPFLELQIPRIGADGAGAAVDDGLGTTTISATYLGAPIPAADFFVVTFNAAGNATHPFLRNADGTFYTVTGGTAGNALVVIRLPFGSFAFDQPPATVQVTVNMSNQADLGFPLTVLARGGYQYGYTPLDDWCCGDLPASTYSANVSSSVLPTLFTLAKTYAGPADTSAETATGLNFPRTYTVTADIAPGQTITDLQITDLLDSNVQYLSLASALPAGYTLVEQPATGSAQNPPFNDLVVTWPSVTGGAGASDASATFSFFVPRDDANLARVIDPDTGAAVFTCNNAQVAGNWTPIDIRDLPQAVSINPGGCEHSLTDRSIATQKGVVNLTDATNSPGDVLEYTIAVQVSDFFAFDTVTVTDVLSDGQHFDPAFTPTLEIAGNGYALPALAMNAANYIVDTSRIDLTDGPPPPPAENPATDGTTTLTFNLSNELVTRGQTVRLIGGCVDPAGGSVHPDCAVYNEGATTATLRFRAVIQEDFTDTYPSGDWSVDQGDTFTDTAEVSGRVLDTAAFTPGPFVTDNAEEGFAIATGALTKSIYAINGVLNPTPPVRIAPGDTVTYRIRYAKPTSDVENLEFIDYLPLPVFFVADPDSNDYDTLPPAGAHNDGPAWSFDPTVSAAAPPSGTAKFGPADTFYAYSGLAPTLTSNTANNRLNFYYGDYDNPLSQPTTIDLLFSVTVATEPFADQMYLTNQVRAIEGSTNAGEVTADGLVQVILTEPIVRGTKGVIWTSNIDDIYNPVNSGPAGITFVDPAFAPRWTGTPGIIHSNGLAARPINSNVRDVDAGDIVTFAITLQNSGTSLQGAFDIQIRDVLNALYQIPAGGLNLQVYYGDRTGPIPYTGIAEPIDCTGSWPGDPCGPDGTADTADDLFGSGIELIDPVGAGVCYPYNPTLGNNVILITYDLQISNSVSPGNIVNTETLLRYAGSPGGPNHVPTPSPYSDTAMVTVSGIPLKYLVSTSEGHTAGNRVAVGEIVRYRAVVRIPESTILNFQLRDNLPNGLTFLNDGTATVAFVSNGGIASVGRDLVPAIPGAPCNLPNPTLPDVVDATHPSSPLPCTLDDFNIGSNNVTNVNPDADTYNTGTDIYFKLGDLTNPDLDDDGEFVIVEFNALVDNQNTDRNDSGDTRNNTLTTFAGVTPVQFGNTSANLAVVVAEPFLTLAKTHSAIGLTADAGDTVTYTATIRNEGAAPTSSTATAFDVDFTDTLDITYMTLVPGSVVITPSGGAAGVTDTSAGNNIAVTIATMPVNSQVTVAYQVTLMPGVTPGQAVNNDAEILWTSLPGPNGTGDVTPGLPGSITGERNGSNGPAGNPNDHDRLATAAINIHDPVFAKYLDRTSATHTAAENLAIGEVATFGLEVTLPEGTTPALQVTDDLPAGLEFVSGSDLLVTETNPPAVCGSLAADFNGSFASLTLTVGPTGDLTFDFGATTVVEDNVTNNNSFLICFDAVVLDAAGNQASPPPQTNSGTLTVGTDTFTDTHDVTIVEPVLQIAKAVNDPNPVPGQIVTFTVYVDHAAASNTNAFDIRIRDNLPADLALDLGSITIAPAGGVAGVTDNSTGNLVDLAVTTFPLGGSLTITYQAQVTAPFGTTINNTAAAEWTSLPGPDANERTGADGPGGALDDYAADSSAPLTANRNFSKSLVADSHPAPVTALPDVTLGEILTYEMILTIPPASSDTYTIVDTLADGLAFVDCEDITADADLTSSLVSLHTAGNCNPGAGGGSNPLVANAGALVTFDFGTVANANPVAPEAIRIRYRAVVLDVAANVGGTTVLNNSAVMTWSTGSLTRTTPDVAVIEPDLDMEKTVDLPTATPGQLLTYTIRVFHTPGSGLDAYDVVVNDTVPVGVTYVPGSLQFLAGSGTAPTSLDDTAIDPGTGQPILRVVWDTLPQGGESSIQFTARFGSISPGTVVTNSANTEWTSLPGEVPAPPATYLSVFNQPYSHERRYDPVNPADTYRVEAAAGVNALSLPETGFARGRFTPLPDQAPELQYSGLDGLRLEIPALGKNLAVVGVPVSGGKWDLSWLWNNAGYLEGTAYPGSAGNSALTAHVYLSNGLPGPFVRLANLRWGDAVILHAGGLRYVYEVRTSTRTLPSDNSVLRHEDRAWLTLVTCQGYNRYLDAYGYRTIVRAVLVRIESET